MLQVQTGTMSVNTFVPAHFVFTFVSTQIAPYDKFRENDSESDINESDFDSSDFDDSYNI